MRLILFFCILSSYTLYGQTDVSISTQVYPTGIIPGLRIDHMVSDKSAIIARVGYQIIDHRDFGVHDNEEGNGYGFSLGYKRYFNDILSKWYWAVKTDLWWNNIDWYDIQANDDRLTGSTDIFVLQPTAEVGYQVLFSNDFFITPSVAFGFEWNVKTTGEPTGEGAILLIGLQFGKRF